MKRTRLQELLFSNTSEEIANQVDNDIKSAQENGVVDTDELKYEHVGNGDVAITDKETGEVTVAQKATDEADTYDLIAVPDGQLEKFLHPSEDGKPGDQVGAPDEDIHDHVGGDNEDDEDEEQHEFSVSTDNTAVLRIFSDQMFCERIFSEVIESEETAKVGDLKIEKIDDEAVVVTDLSSGDQARVEFDDDEMEVTELDSKEFCDDCEDLDGDSEGGFMPYHIVGIQPYDHLLVDSPARSLDDAQALQAQLLEDGVDAVKIFDNQADARDYAMSLLEGVDAEEVGEPVEQEYSDTSIYVTPYGNDDTMFMCRAFSEATSGIADLQDDVENAIADGEEIETDDEVITPVDALNAVVEDKNNGEFTKATISGTDLLLRAIDEDDANELLDGISVVEEAPEDDEDEDETCPECDDEDDEEEEEKEYSLTDFMIRLYSEETDTEAIEDAIENGDEIETDEDIITPIDNSTAVVEDKNSGEYTKVVLVGDEEMNLHPISEDEAENLLEDIAVEEEGVDEEDEKDFSDIYCDEDEIKFFSEYEDFTDYMTRLYSDEADQEDVERAIADGEQIETDNEVITPVDASTAVVEDKESEEFTKVTLDEDGMNVEKIDEDEADDLTDGLAVEEEGVDEDKKFSYAESATLDKFFADIAMAQAPEGTPTVVNENGNEVPVAVDEEGEVEAGSVAPTVEEAEDKAEAAIQSIQAAAAEAASMIAEAKAAPAPNQEPDLQETQFSEFEETNNNETDTLVSWLGGIKY